MIKVIYAGRRLSDKNKLCYLYYIAGTTEDLLFSRPLDKIIYAIGTCIKCERTDTGVKGPYHLMLNEKAGPDRVNDWSIQDKVAVEKRQEISDAKKAIDGDIKILVDRIYRMPRNERLRIVKYLIGQLL